MPLQILPQFTPPPASSTAEESISAAMAAADVAQAKAEKGVWIIVKMIDIKNNQEPYVLSKAYADAASSYYGVEVERVQTVNVVNESKTSAIVPAPTTAPSINIDELLEDKNYVTLEEMEDMLKGHIEKDHVGELLQTITPAEIAKAIAESPGLLTDATTLAANVVAGRISLSDVERTVGGDLVNLLRDSLNMQQIYNDTVAAAVEKTTTEDRLITLYNTANNAVLSRLLAFILTKSADTLDDLKLALEDPQAKITFNVTES